MKRTDATTLVLVIFVALATASCITPTRTADSDQPSASQIPWQSLRKDHTSLLTLFLSFREGRLSPDAMLRNSQLNPRDREISSEDRVRLGVLFESAIMEVQVMREAMTKGVGQQMIDLVASGKATRAKLNFSKKQLKRYQDKHRAFLESLGTDATDDQIRLQRYRIDHPEWFVFDLLSDEAKAQGKRAVVYGNAEVVYVAEVKDLPGERLRRGGESLVFELFTHACADGFLSVGALTKKEAAELQALTLAEVRAANWDWLINRSR